MRLTSIFTFTVFFMDEVRSFTSFPQMERLLETVITQDQGQGQGQRSQPRQLQDPQSFIQRRLFNSSVALSIPLVSFALPQKATHGSTLDLANQAIFGLFTLLVSVVVLTVPVMFTGVRKPLDAAEARGYNGNKKDDEDTILKNLMASTSLPGLNLMGADLQHKIGLSPRKCLEKTICEAHRSPKNKRYGLLALPFQIFFPPLEKDSRLRSSSSSIFQLAAEEGKYSDAECGEKFKCFFDLLDLSSYFVEWYQFSMEHGE